MKNRNKLFAAVLLAVASYGSGIAQSYSCATCPELDERNVINLSTMLDAQGNLLNNHTILTCENMYIMDERVYVNNGQTLTILPGTVIKAEYEADPEETNALIVTRGGKIYAEGSECAPIIFTSVEDPLDGTYSVLNKERWGGIIILGKAQNNVAAGELNPENPNFVTGGTAIGLGNMEGLVGSDPRHWYGMEGGAANFINNDNSGVLKYVSIRHGGSELGVNNEINALTLGSVGSGTVIRFIEVVSNGDDGIEFFGGTVDLKYAKIMYCEDDYLDWDQGYSGRIQFVIGVQLPGTTAYGDNGLECDGDDGDDYARPFLSSPIISNVTILGNDQGTSGDRALELKERTQGEIYNSIFANFNTGINYVAGTQAVVENNTFVKVLNYASGITPDPSNVNVATLDGFDPDFTINNMTSANSYDAVPSGGVVGVVNTKNVHAIDPFFDAVDYRGAFDPTKGPWWNMDACSITGFVPRVDVASQAAYPCPTDITKDGVTNATDLGEIIGQYNNKCMD